jgi:D-alanyl-D-alanine carboxypeptidase/D-alanyl-D-alanine-endopeptidase (penicillin-binding protein 4)
VLQKWVSAIKDAGIDSISGEVIGNAAHLQGLALPRTRIWEDMGNYYGTGIYGLNFNDNTYFVSFSTPDEPGLSAKVVNVYPEVPQLSLESEVVSSTIQSDRAFIFGSPLDTKRVIRGTLPAGRDRFTIKGSIPDPALFAAHHLSERLEEAGISISQNPASEYEIFREPVTYKILTEIESPPLKDLVRHINMESDNLMAEGLLLQLGAKAGEASIEGGLDALRSFLKGIWGENARFFAYDGSGLSRFNSVSAKQICDLLVRANSNQVLKTHLLNELPRAGKEGSVKWFGLHTNLAGNTRLKSGSMEGVKAYAGVLTTYTGRELAFAIMVNNFGMPSVELRKKIEEWLIRAYGQF